MTGWSFVDDHLAIWPVLIPLLAAPLIVVVGQRGIARYASVAAMWLSFAASVMLSITVERGGPIHYQIGGWEPPYGIEYVADAFSTYMLILVSFIGAIVLTACGESFRREVAMNKWVIFYATFLLCLTGLMGMCATGDLFNVFVFLEISSLSSYALISLGRDRRAPLAALRYLIIGTVGATFFLIGIGLLYQTTGTLNMTDLAHRLPRESGSRTLVVAFAMMTVGLAIKMALFPLHTWLPAAYTSAPSGVTAMLAATSTKVSVYAFIRLVHTIFTRQYAFENFPLGDALMAFSLMGIFVASIAAIFQSNVKRLLAYSSVAQVGYMLLGVSMGTTGGLAAGVSHLMNHAVIKGGLFLVVAAVVLRTGSSDLIAFRGLGRRMPMSAGMMTIGLLGLIGVPLTAGFVTKWLLLTEALAIGSPVVAAMMLASSLLAVVYSWRIIETMYFESAEPPIESSTPSPWAMRLGTAVMIGSVIGLGVWTKPSVGMARAAAASLVNGDRLDGSKPMAAKTDHLPSRDARQSRHTPTTDSVAVP